LPKDKWELALDSKFDSQSLTCPPLETGPRARTHTHTHTHIHTHTHTHTHTYTHIHTHTHTHTYTHIHTHTHTHIHARAYIRVYPSFYEGIRGYTISYVSQYVADSGW